MTDTAKQLAAELFPRDDEAAQAAAMLIQRALSEKDSRIADLERQLADARESSSLAQETAKEYMEQRDALREQLAEARGKEQYVAQQLASLDCGVAPVEELARRAARSIEQLNVKWTQANRLETENAALREQLAEAKRERDAFRTEADAWRKSWEQASANLAAITKERDAEVAHLKEERDKAVAFANRVERGEVSFVAKVATETVLIAGLPIGKRADESLSQAVNRVLTERDALKGQLSAAQDIIKALADGPMMKKFTALNKERDDALQTVRVLERHLEKIKAANDQLRNQLEIIGAIVGEPEDKNAPNAYIHAVEKYAARFLQAGQELERAQKELEQAHAPDREQPTKGDQWTSDEMGG